MVKCYTIRPIERYTQHIVYLDKIACFFSKQEARNWAEKHDIDIISRTSKYKLKIEYKKEEEK